MANLKNVSLHDIPVDTFFKYFNQENAGRIRNTMQTQNPIKVGTNISYELIPIDVGNDIDASAVITSSKSTEIINPFYINQETIAQFIIDTSDAVNNVKDTLNLSEFPIFENNGIIKKPFHKVKHIQDGVSYFSYDIYFDKNSDESTENIFVINVSKNSSGLLVDNGDFVKYNKSFDFIDIDPTFYTFQQANYAEYEIFKSDQDWNYSLNKRYYTLSNNPTIDDLKVCDYKRFGNRDNYILNSRKRYILYAKRISC